MPEQDPLDKPELQRLLDTVAGTGGDKSSWPATVFLLTIFIILLSVLGIKLALTKRKAAELASELRSVKEKETEAAENAKMAQNEIERTNAAETVKDAQLHIDEIKEGLQQAQAEHQQYVKELQSVTNWDQINIVDGRDHDRG
jgi:hypothetical protein